jgi:hypothetical protein
MNALEQSGIGSRKQLIVKDEILGHNDIKNSIINTYVHLPIRSSFETMEGRETIAMRTRTS